MVIFHSYVSLPEGKPISTRIFFHSTQWIASPACSTARCFASKRECLPSKTRARPSKASEDFLMDVWSGWGNLWIVKPPLKQIPWKPDLFTEAVGRGHSVGHRGVAFFQPKTSLANHWKSRFYYHWNHLVAYHYHIYVGIISYYSLYICKSILVLYHFLIIIVYLLVLYSTTTWIK